MRQGRTLQEIASELERQTASRKDYLAAQGAVEAKVIDGEVVLDGFNHEPLAIAPFAHGQIGDHLEIPRRYYERMKVEQPTLLAANINTWLRAEGNDKRMIRTLDGRVRAFLSPRFRPLDNFDLANAVLPTLLERKVQIVSAELTETRLYIKGILPDLSDELPGGLQWGVGHNAATGMRTYGREGRVVAAIVISNSEVGAGTLRVEPSMFTTWCTNLAIMAEAAMRKYHVGRAFDADANLEVFRDETRMADDRAFFMKVQDVCRAAFAEDIWKAAMAQLKDATRNDITSDNLPRVVEVAVKQLALPERATGGILKHLAAGGDLTQWGLSSAVTQVANDWADYEGATDLERAGGKVLALRPQEWEAIAKAA